MPNYTYRTRQPIQQKYYGNIDTIDVKQVRIKTKKYTKKKPKSFVAFVFALVLLGLYGYFICPYIFRHYIKPLYINRFLNRNLEIDLASYLNPTRDYAHNSFLFGDYLLVSPQPISKKLTPIKLAGEMTSTKNKILALAQAHPRLKLSVFVFEYAGGKGIEINSNEPFASASIIKIPIAFELMRIIDKTSKTQEPVKLTDKRMYTDQYKTEGSGKLQYTQSNVEYSIDYLANIMISNSDNSATNMLLEEIGGIDGFNRAMRNLGLKVTSMREWLPDYDGTNKITAREISTILYNIDNPNYINPDYKNILKEYLGATKNVHLIKEKLPQNALVFHKTGNIGSMIGDSGIVYAENGKKYIVTILVQRPHNDLSANLFIQDISEIIYKDIVNMY